MSEDNKVPGAPPPDDFSKTTPNIDVGGDDGAGNDWNKTNYNFPKQPAADDWGKTVTNISPIDTENQGFGNTFSSNSQSQPKAADWGVTNANVNVNAADFGSAPEDFGSVGYDKTTPYFSLPEAERAKYQNLPPTPTEKAEQERKEREEKGGIPGWLWASGGLLGMFVFAVLVLGFVFFFMIRETSFEVTVRQAPAGSRIIVDGKQQWGVDSADGTRKLTDLAPGTRIIEIHHPNWECAAVKVPGEAGDTREEVARCTPIEAPPEEKCETFNPGEFDKAERCYYRALGALAKPYTAEDLVKALDILIINFETGSHAIPNARLAAIQKGAEYIQGLPADVVLEVGGHTDNQGTDQTNQPLSERRAKAVKDKLVEFGVRSEALQTRGYGSSRPKFDNNTDNGKFLNRRIGYAIVGKP